MDLDFRFLLESFIEKSYAPYSKFRVASIIISKNGKIFRGVNVENSSYGLTICAERNALFQMVSQGERGIRVLAIGATSYEPVLPCGACLQVLNEFTEGDFPIISYALNSGEVSFTTFKKIFPRGFKLA